jgi:hypothetical protein
MLHEEVEEGEICLRHYGRKSRHSIELLGNIFDPCISWDDSGFQAAGCGLKCFPEGVGSCAGVLLLSLVQPRPA